MYDLLYEKMSNKIQINLKVDVEIFQDNVAYGLPYHPLVGAGEIRNPISDLCLDKNDRTEFMDHPLDVLPCHGLAGHQYWWMNKNRFLICWKILSCYSVCFNSLLTLFCDYEL